MAIEYGVIVNQPVLPICTLCSHNNSSTTIMRYIAVFENNYYVDVHYCCNEIIEELQFPKMWPF